MGCSLLQSKLESFLYAGMTLAVVKTHGDAPVKKHSIQDVKKMRRNFVLK